MNKKRIKEEIACLSPISNCFSCASVEDRDFKN